MTNTVNFAQPDVTLRLDPAGIIQRAVVANAVSDEDIATWQGRRWADTIDGDRAQLQEMIGTVWTTGLSPVHRVQQRFPSGRALAVEYTTVRIDGDGLLAIGRSLEAVADVQSRLISASTSMEHSAWKLRDLETRQRLLFEVSRHPALLVGAEELRILEANPAALQAVGPTHGGVLLPESDARQRTALRAMLDRVGADIKVPGIVLRLGPTQRPWLVRASVLAEWAPVFLLKLSPAGWAAPDEEEATRERAGQQKAVADGVAMVERQCLEAVLLRTNGDRASLARRLGITLESLEKKLAGPSDERTAAKNNPG